MEHFSRDKRVPCNRNRVYIQTSLYVSLDGSTKSQNVIQRDGGIRTLLRDMEPKKNCPENCLENCIEFPYTRKMSKSQQFAHVTVSKLNLKTIFKTIFFFGIRLQIIIISFGAVALVEQQRQPFLLGLDGQWWIVGAQVIIQMPSCSHYKIGSNKN